MQTDWQSLQSRLALTLPLAISTLGSTRLEPPLHCTIECSNSGAVSIHSATLDLGSPAIQRHHLPGYRLAPSVRSLTAEALRALNASARLLTRPAASQLPPAHFLSLPAMLPFYSLLEHPHRACAWTSRDRRSLRRAAWTFSAPITRLSTYRATQSAAGCSSERTCGDQAAAASRSIATSNNDHWHAAATMRGSKQRGEEQKEQLDSRNLEDLLAYPGCTLASTARRRYSQSIKPNTEVRDLHVCHRQVAFTDHPVFRSSTAALSRDRRRSSYTQFTARVSVQQHMKFSPDSQRLSSTASRSITDAHPCALLRCGGALCCARCVAGVGLLSDSSEYLQHYSASTPPSSPPADCLSSTVPLSFPRPGEQADDTARPLQQVQRAADPLAPYGGRSAAHDRQHTRYGRRSVAARTQRTAIELPPAAIAAENVASSSYGDGTHTVHSLLCLCSVRCFTCPTVPAGSRRTSCTKSDLGIHGCPTSLAWQSQPQRQPRTPSKGHRSSFVI